MAKGHANILVLHKEKKMVLEVRQDMIDMEPHTLLILDDQETPIDVVREKMEAGSWLPDIKGRKKIKQPVAKPTDEPDVILTGKGEPFKSEQTARAAMKSKGLSEDEWTVLPVVDDGDGGFIITKG